MACEGEFCYHGLCQPIPTAVFDVRQVAAWTVSHIKCSAPRFLTAVYVEGRV